MEFSESALESAKSGAKRIENCVFEAIKFVGEQNVLKNVEINPEFEKAMDEDLNTSRALALVFALTTDCNKALVEKDFYKVQNLLSQIVAITSVFSLICNFFKKFF